MIKFNLIALSILTLSSGSVMADTVIKHIPDNSAGNVTGAWSSFLVGGALGGPIGAIAGGLFGAWAGGSVQQATGTSGNSYVIRKDNGEEVVIRSPIYNFQIGDEVEIKGIRAYPIAR